MTRPRRATLSEVARVSGVSPSTASHILNRRTTCYASAQTRQRVQDAARRLGYRPNLAARGLRGGDTATLGLITTALHVEPTSVKCMAFEALARAAGYLTVISFNPNEPETEDRLIQWLRDRCVDGVVLHVCEEGQHAQLRSLVQERFPVVTLSAARLNLDTDDVSLDGHDGGRQQALHLAHTGRRRVVIFRPTIVNDSIDRRVLGARDGLVGAGLPEPTVVTMPEPDSPEDSPTMRQWLRDHAGVGEFDAIIGTNDEIAVQAMRTVLDLGLRVPDDVAMLGFDDSKLARNAPVPLTSIRQPVHELAQAAFELLIARIREPQRPAVKRMLTPSLVIRRSTQASA